MRSKGVFYVWHWLATPSHLFPEIKGLQDCLNAESFLDMAAA